MKNRNRAGLEIPAPRERRISPAEPVSELRHIPIVESGEDLVDFLRLCPALTLDQPRFKYTRATLLRASVAERLCRAAAALPEGYRLAVIEGWRPRHIQRRMYQRIWEQFRRERPDWSDLRLKRLVNRYTAPLDNRVPPPHTTGGAVDLLLAGPDGRALDHCSPYDRYDPAGFAFQAEGLTDEARRIRAILAAAMLSAGLTNYPSEYWHWSYGDQGWAYRGGHGAAIFGPIEPPDWEPPPEDLADTPLEWVEEQAYG